MELMNNLMSVYNNCKSTVPAGSISVADFLNKIRNEVFKKEIQKLRSIIDKKQRDAYKSSELKAVNYAGIFQERKNDLLTLCCNVIILDIDDVPNGKLKRLKAVIAKDEHTLAVWESPSGNGLKVMVKMYFGYSATTYKARYLCVLNYYASKFDIPIKDGRSSRNTATWGFDLSCSDVARLCIYSADKDIYINEESTVFAAFNTFSATEKKVLTLIEKIRDKQIDITPTYDEWFRIGCSLHHEFGEAGRGYYHSISCYYPNYTEDETNKVFDSIIKSQRRGITIATLFDIAKQHDILISSTSISYAAKNNSKDDTDVFAPDEDEFTINPVSYPIDIFPNEAKEYIEEVCNSVGCSMDLIGVAVLGAISGAIGGTREAETMSGHRQSANLYLGLIAPPSSKKSPAMSRANVVVEWKQAKAKDDYDAEMREYNEKLSAWEESKRNKKQKRSKKQEKKQEEIVNDEMAAEETTEEGKPEKPVMHQYFVSDFTMEVLSSILSVSSRGIMVIADELNGWINSMGLYKNGKGNDKQKWLSMWSRENLKVDRKNDEPIFVKRPFVTIVGGIQPEVLREYVIKNIRDGFIDRFLFTFPERVLRYSNKRVSSIAKDNYFKLIKELYDFEHITAYRNIQETGSAEHETDAFVIPLDAEANKLWDEWNMALIEEMSNPFFPYYLEGAWGKLVGHTLRFALIFYCLNSRNRGVSRVVTAEDVRCAFRLSEYFKYHIFKAMSYCNDSDVDVSVNSIYSGAKKNGGSISRREVYKNKIGGCKTPESVQKIFEEMEKRKLGTIETRTPSNGGRTTVLFIISNSHS